MSKLKEMRLKKQIKAIDLAKLLGTSRQNICIAEKKAFETWLPPNVMLQHSTAAGMR